MTCLKLEPGEPMPVAVFPTTTADDNDRPRFLMPPLPFSTLYWLGTFGETVWQQHERCCALLLLLNTEFRSWGLTAPPQSPRRDGVSWRLADAVPHGEVDPEQLFVAGSFQTTRLTSPDEAQSLVPCHDGLHLVHSVEAEEAGAWCYLRVAGKLDTPHPETLIFDDYGARIYEVMRYLNLPQ
jgi:hypothetical protein